MDCDVVRYNGVAKRSSWPDSHCRFQEANVVFFEIEFTDADDAKLSVRLTCQLDALAAPEVRFIISLGLSS